MNRDILRIRLAGVKSLLFVFLLYILKMVEIGMGWDFSRLGIYPLKTKGMLGVLTHPLIHSDFNHLLANTFPLLFLSWCLFYFYREIAGCIFVLIWIGSGVLTFLIGKPGWHIGASGLIYGLAFFLFFSGILRKHVPLIAISLLITFLYGGIIWHMFPQFSPPNMSWEGHLSGGIAGMLCAFLFESNGPQRPDPFKDEQEDEEGTCYSETREEEPFL
ncbi:rhomboid family intramembrane serine protease [Bacteroides pyogenes]|uniref:Rhomboid family intramembrane serine protease n=3 Tax=Bacteroides pyogenes TaxID=310300 RepID=A0A5D3EFY2_9BACE|nr:rhomboid family intramembrane serine protease [Bacteroides pyogenes]GAE14732.1 possible membrane protein [Bacteroides pyogenes JCM 6292]MCE9106653.1 rhomboid family intramembrane serine protease [Bacteroides pyogenes]MCI7070274.1 rhomboid family intramembrane serine protease [Bacteroides pyogenes]MDY5352637.1 rhomboid family intramembrane serine protease [Bacteroides pyogenes]MDY5433240.1 rhomboid family intramembrane serine protease [Bacteroides pyogenes]